MTSPTVLLRAALLLLAGVLLPTTAAVALSDQTPPTAFIVTEDFAPLLNQWQAAAGTWTISAGTYNSTAAGSADIATIAAYREIDPSGQLQPRLPFDQYSFRARVRNKGTSAGQLVGVVYQYQDPANYFEAVISATGVVSLRRTFNGSTDRLRSFDVGVPRDTWVDIEVLRDKGVTTLNVNGQPVFVDLLQPGFEFGRIGLVAHGTVGQYDKVQVTTPFGDQPFKHDFSSEAPGWMPLSGQWNVANGTYNNAAVQHTNVTLAPIETGVTPGSDETGPFTVHARMLNPFGGSGNLVGIVFNHTGSAYTEVVFSPTGVAKMNLVSNGTVQTLATAAYGGRRNAWFDVTLDSTATVWVDGEKIFDQVPGAHPDFVPTGGVGLITHWAPGKFDDVWFDHGTFKRCSETFSSSTVPETVSGTWNVSSGTLNGTSVNASSIALPCRLSGNLSGADDGTDFVYSARLLNQYGGSGNLVGLIFNYQEPFSLYAGDYYELVFSPTGSAFLNKFIQGVRYRVGTFPHNVPRNTWFDVQLFRNGINTTFKVNGTTIASDVPQGELRGGRSGVVTHWAQGRFDNLSVLPHTGRNPPVTYLLTHIATVLEDSPITGQFRVAGMNDTGELVGSRVGSDGRQQAFVWRGGAFQNLNPLLPAGVRGSGADRINNQSDVMGSYEDQQFQGQPFFLSGSGQPIPLTGLPSGAIFLNDLNDRREILLSAAEGGVQRQFVWRAGQLTPLEMLPGAAHMTGVAINNQGVALGYAQSPTFQFTPVLWHAGSVMPLTFPEGSQTGLARALNDHGAVVSSAVFNEDFPQRSMAFIWHEGETTVLQPADPVFNQTSPDDINNRGVVVGVSFNLEGSIPTVWDGPRGQELNSLISHQDPLRPFVRLHHPRLINNRGQIVAHGVDVRQPQDRVSWYLLTPQTR